MDKGNAIIEIEDDYIAAVLKIPPNILKIIIDSFHINAPKMSEEEIFLTLEKYTSLIVRQFLHLLYLSLTSEEAMALMSQRILNHLEHCAAEFKTVAIVSKSD